MVRDKKFNEEFWDSDYIGSQGFDVLVKKMKDGHKMCKDAEDFFKQRAKCEEDYAKGLQKLVKSSSNVPESGSLKYCWDEMRCRMDHIAQEHLDSAKQYNEEAARLAMFAEQQRTQRKQNESLVSAAMKNKKDLHKKCLDSKRSYDAKCRESENQDLYVENSRKTGQCSLMKPQDWDKLVIKRSKASIDAQNSEKTYRDTLAMLEESRLHWQKEMTNLCDMYEKIEDARINFLRNELWVASNICSQVCVEDDKHAECTRQALEKCDADADIMDFVNKNRVGQNCPGKIPFQPYISGVTNQPWSPGEQQQQQQAGAARPAQPLPNRNQPPPMRQAYR